MKRFLVIYSSPKEVLAQMAQSTPEQTAEAMQAWGTWGEKCGSALVEMGAPLSPGHRTTKGNGWGESSTPVSGYSIVQANTIDEARALFVDHPHISWAPGCTIDLHETVSL